MLLFFFKMWCCAAVLTLRVIPDWKNPDGDRKWWPRSGRWPIRRLRRLPGWFGLWEFTLWWLCISLLWKWDKVLKPSWDAVWGLCEERHGSPEQHHGERSLKGRGHGARHQWQGQRKYIFCLHHTIEFACIALKCKRYNSLYLSCSPSEWTDGGCDQRFSRYCHPPAQMSVYRHQPPRQWWKHCPHDRCTGWYVRKCNQHQHLSLSRAQNNNYSFNTGFIIILNYILNYYRGVDTEVQDPRGFTALIKAGLQGREECVSALLMHGEFRNLNTNRDLHLD